MKAVYPKRSTRLESAPIPLETIGDYIVSMMQKVARHIRQSELKRDKVKFIDRIKLAHARVVQNNYKLS